MNKFIATEHFSIHIFIYSVFFEEINNSVLMIFHVLDNRSNSLNHLI